MDKKIWTGRERADISMARRAASSPARLIHLELAGRYGIQAGRYRSGNGREPGMADERKVIQPPKQASPRPGSTPDLPFP